MADTKHTRRRAHLPPASSIQSDLTQAGERTKVLVSLSEDDLRRIDERAAAAGMSRSAYLVSVARSGDAGIFDAIHRLELELQRFQSENGGWKAAEQALRAEIDRLTERMRMASGLLDRYRDLLESTNAMGGDQRLKALTMKMLAAVKDTLTV